MSSSFRNNFIYWLNTQIPDIDTVTSTAKIIDLLGVRYSSFLKREFDIWQENETTHIDAMVQIVSYGGLGSYNCSVSEVEESLVWLKRYIIYLRISKSKDHLEWRISSNVDDDADIKSRVDSAVKYLLQKYENCPARTLAQVEKENPIIKFAFFNVWTKRIYQKTASQYLTDVGVITPKYIVASKTKPATKVIEHGKVSELEAALQTANYAIEDIDKELNGIKSQPVVYSSQKEKLAAVDEKLSILYPEIVKLTEKVLEVKKTANLLKESFQSPEENTSSSEYEDEECLSQEQVLVQSENKSENLLDSPKENPDCIEHIEHNLVAKLAEPVVVPEIVSTCSEQISENKLVEEIVELDSSELSEQQPEADFNTPSFQMIMSESNKPDTEIETQIEEDEQKNISLDEHNSTSTIEGKDCLQKNVMTDSEQESENSANEEIIELEEIKNSEQQTETAIESPSAQIVMLELGKQKTENESDIEEYERNKTQNADQESQVMTTGYPDDAYLRRVYEYSFYLKDYLDEAEVFVFELELSSRAYNVLKLNQINKLSEVLFRPDSSLRRLHFASEPVIVEIVEACISYIRNHKKEFESYIDSCIHPMETEETHSVQLSIYDIRELLCGEKKETIKNALLENNILLEQLDLSTRTYNALKRGHINSLADALDFYPDRFEKIKNLGSKSTDEIKRIIEETLKRILSSGANEVIGGVSSEYSQIALGRKSSIPVPLVSTPPKNVLEALMHPKYREQVFEFVRLFDIQTTEMNLSVRTINVLMREELTTLSKILTRYPFRPSDFDGMGEKSINELSYKVEQILSGKEQAFSFFLKGDMDSLYSDMDSLRPEDFIKEEILNAYNKDPYYGYSLSDFITMLGEHVSEKRIKHIVGSLLAEKKLEYVDFRCYKVYLSFYTYLQEYIEHGQGNERHIEALKLLYEGNTLEEIAKGFNVTRERIRQIAGKELKKLRNEYRISYKTSIFDEDFYAYFYENYSVDKKCWLDYIGIDERTFTYLKRSYTQGKDASFENILSDEKVPASLKIRIMDFIHKDEIIIDGLSFPSERATIEEYIISIYCKDDIRWDDYVALYNAVLEKNRVPYDERVYYSDSVGASRKNKISEENYCLWKMGKTLRAYAINSRDFTKLIDAIGIPNYKNTGVSTLKWFNDFPELMDEYDIHDQYELHNLLKKILPNGSYNDMQFVKQPSIVFGAFDRDAAMYNLMATNSPITKEDLADKVFELYGYDRALCLSTYFLCLDKYYHDGLYSVDFKPISEEKVGYLKSVLTEDFYYVSEVQKIYLDLFPEADIQEINPRSLKMLGFQHLSNYILKNHRSLTEYFTDLLTRDEVFDYQSIRNRFTYVQMFSQISSDLRRNYDIFLYGNGQAVSFKRLEKLGVTKQDILDYCNSIIEFVGDGEYFTIHTLREQGFSDPLDDLGFDDEFYEGILEVCPDIFYTKCSNTSVFICGQEHKGFQRKDFLISIINEYKSISVDELEDLLVQDYGITLTIRLQDCLSGTSVYYDSIMERFYDSKNTYYDELN